MSEKSYWGYRINYDEIDFFRKELETGRLRQGWGWLKGQNLRHFRVDHGARRNFAMFNKVKAGDLLLVPRLPSWGEVAVVQATEDWNAGYRYEIHDEKADYGHIFPAKLLASFVRNNEHVPASIRSTLKNISRFWNANHCGPDIESLLQQDAETLRNPQSFEARFRNTIEDSFAQLFDSRAFSTTVSEKMRKQFGREEWEYALIYGLRELLPSQYVVEHVGGRGEEHHGTDILVTMPGLLGDEYAIAIQVKDYDGYVGSDVIAQIGKADAYWTNENRKLVDKIVVVTRATKTANQELDENPDGVRVVFADQLYELIFKISKGVLGLTDE